MKESEYIALTNLTKAKIARTVISDMLPGPVASYGITDKEHQQLMILLGHVQGRLYAMIDGTIKP